MGTESEVQVMRAKAKIVFWLLVNPGTLPRNQIYIHGDV